MASGGKLKISKNPGEVIAVIRRVLAENGRDYVWHYAFATVCLLAIAATTAFSAWIMRSVIDIPRVPDGHNIPNH